MLRHPSRGVLAALAAALLAACSPTLDWRRVDLAPSLEALFPCKVDRRERRDVAIGDGRHTVQQASCEVSGMTFSALVVAHAAAASAAERQALAQALEGSAAGNLQAPTQAASAILPARPDAPAQATRLRHEGRRPDGSRVVVEQAQWNDAQRVVQLAVVGERLQPEAVDAFFEGLSRVR